MVTMTYPMSIDPSLGRAGARSVPRCGRTGGLRDLASFASAALPLGGPASWHTTCFNGVAQGG